MIALSLLVGCGPHVTIAEGELCAVEGARRGCLYDTERLKPGTLAARRVHFQTPLGEAPEAGWPVAVLFQGSFHPAAKFWEAKRSSNFGGWHQTATVEALLDAGFAVVTPDAQTGGNSFWNTNVVGWETNWEASPDHQLMELLLDELDAGTFGPTDPTRRVAAGISSGGYMTSRMALSYPGEFAALAIQSGSWATCSGALCSIPDALPDDHPPTLFLHGEKDDIVGIGTMEPYADGLEAAGHTVRVVVDPDVGHAWLPAAPQEVVAWFTEHAP